MATIQLPRLAWKMSPMTLTIRCYLTSIYCLSIDLMAVPFLSEMILNDPAQKQVRVSELRI